MGDLFNSERLHRRRARRLSCVGGWGCASIRCFPLIPPGTLAANLIGGYMIGVAVAILLYLEGQDSDRGTANRHQQVQGVSTF